MKKLNIIMLFCAFCGITTYAQTDFEDYVSAIVENNITLKSKYVEFKTSSSELNTINNLSDPEIGFSHRWGQGGIGNKWDVDIRQSFDWPGAYVSRRRETDFQKSALDALYLESKRQITYEIKSTIYTIIAANRMIALYNDVQLTLDSLIAVYEKGLRMGEISILDVNKLKVETISNQRKLNDAKIERDKAYEKLSTLNGGMRPAEYDFTHYPSASLDDINVYLRLAANNPLLRYNELMNSASLQSIATTKMESLPGFSVGYVHEYEMGERFNGFSVGVTLPFFSNRKKSVAAQHAAEQYSLAKQVVDTETQSLIKENYESAASLKREIESYRPIFESGNNLVLLDKALKGGQISLVQYLQEMRFFIEAKADYYEAINQYHQRLLSLNQYN